MGGLFAAISVGRIVGYNLDIATLVSKIFGLFLYFTMPQKKTPPNPLYVKIGNRIRQGRKMAGETNSRALSERLGWSGGRINNFETGYSTPGVEETLDLCKALGLNPCWVTYGIGSPTPAATQAARYKNLMGIVSEAESRGTLSDLLSAIKIAPAALEKYRANPYKKITDRQARNCEQFLDRPYGWLDIGQGGPDASCPLPEDQLKLLVLYEKLPKKNRQKLFAMMDLLLGDSG
jgi:transcriptional regulator with XRE-family HTH domain